MESNIQALVGDEYMNSIQWIVGILFSVVIGGILLVQNRNDLYYEKMMNLTEENLSSLRFYQDGLRDPRSLDLPVTQKEDIQNFLRSMKTMKPSSWAIKSLNHKILTQMRMEFLEKSEKQIFTIQIFRADQTGDLGIISISREGSVFTTPGGIYESKQLLDWAEEMGKREGFENITISY